MDLTRDVVYRDHPDFEMVKGTQTIIDQTRWSTVEEAVFLHKPTGKYYELSWSHGSTESQDESPFEYGDPEPVEVIEKEVLVKQWVYVGD